MNQVLACNATLGYEEIFNVQVSTAQHSRAWLSAAQRSAAQQHAPYLGWFSVCTCLLMPCQGHKQVRSLPPSTMLCLPAPTAQPSPQTSHPFTCTQVHKFNGQPVRNLRHLAEMVLTCPEPQMRFDVEYSVRCIYC